MKKYNSKIEAVKDYLTTNKTITSWDAIKNFGATRLSGIIYVLKNRDGWTISSSRKQVKTRYGFTSNVAVYTLIKKPKEKK